MRVEQGGEERGGGYEDGMKRDGEKEEERMEKWEKEKWDLSLIPSVLDLSPLAHVFMGERERRAS